MNNQVNAAGGISIHAVDISRGIPAESLKVSLYYLRNGELAEIASGCCDRDGLLQHPVSTGEGVKQGTYEVQFDVGSYYRKTGIELPKPAFLETAHFRFGIAQVTEHFHLPFKFTPWGLSLFRGGA